MKLIIANFKSHKNRSEYESWMAEFEKRSASLPDTARIILCPPAVDLSFFANQLLDKKKFPSSSLGVQDISPFPAGAYTGAVCGRNLEGFGVTHAIVGHSERRRYFHETDNDIANKAREALSAGLTPIVCVTKETVSSQAQSLESADRKKVIAAFEPIENIGTGLADTLEDILATRILVETAFGPVPYIYGGSVDPKTDPRILTHPDIDGFLVGSSSLNAEEFYQLITRIQ